ncbi:MAG: hypothetical protein IIY96_01680 [Lachnospiraceae bacterium]|nr:hypothetical protein [Lachnospiraceae bacterium]MBQ2040983.1 hypothetical protein [Lachnospiraceae bacterium]
MNTDQIGIGDLPLSLTAYLCLKRAGYRTLGDLSRSTQRDVMEIRELTRRNLEEIIKCMAGYGQRFSSCISA